MATKIQEILLNEKSNYMNKYHLDEYELKCYNYMAACGSETFGYNAYQCEDCGHKLIHYNSCGNRHCPSCQAKSREEWINKIESFLLDIPYFHMVFTIPDSLNDICLNNKETMYQILFKASAQTLIKVAEPVYGKIGFSSILHTWGANMWIHPHIHMIVSSGGIYGDSFKHSPKNFLLPVKALSKVFKGKFIDSMKKSQIYDSNHKLIDFNDEPYKSLICELYQKDWVVYSKKPFDNNKAVLNYIGRYSHRVAISNSRIKEYNQEAHTVTFSYKDYKDECKIKEMTVDAIEFIHRFMMHILPSRFMKIRHYGFMSNNCRKTMIPLCRSLLNQVAPPTDSSGDKDNEPTWCHCPKCSGKLILYHRVLLQTKHTDSS